MKNRILAALYGGIFVLFAYISSSIISVEYWILWITAAIWYFVSLNKIPDKEK